MHKDAAAACRLENHVGQPIGAKMAMAAMVVLSPTTLGCRTSLISSRKYFGNPSQQIYWHLSIHHVSNMLASQILSRLVPNIYNLGLQFCITRHLYFKTSTGGICIFHSADSCSSRRVTLKKSCLEEARSIKSSTCSWSGYTNAM